MWSGLSGKYPQVYPISINIIFDITGLPPSAGFTVSGSGPVVKENFFCSDPSCRSDTYLSGPYTF